MSEIERAIEKKEYIERGALIAFVREVRKKLPKDSKDFFTRDEMLLNFQQYVEHQPAADVAEVVRCKDCRYFDVTQTYLCDMHHRAANEDDYCSYGIRKMDGEKEGV
jgi:hypothetical protein